MVPNPPEAPKTAPTRKKRRFHPVLLLVGLTVLLTPLLLVPSGHTPTEAVLRTKSIEVAPSQDGLDLLRGEPIESIEVSGFDRIEGSLRPEERQASSDQAVFKKGTIREMQTDWLASSQPKSPPQITVRYDQQADVLQVIAQSLRSSLILDLPSPGASRKRGLAPETFRTVELSGSAISVVIRLTRSHSYQITGEPSVAVKGVAFLAPGALEPTYALLSGQVTVAGGPAISLQPSQKLVLQGGNSCILRSLGIPTAGKGMEASLYGEFRSVILERPGFLGDLSWTKFDELRSSKVLSYAYYAFVGLMLAWEALLRVSAKEGEA